MTVDSPTLVTNLNADLVDSAHGGGGITLQQVYPVGSIYMNIGVATNPNTLFGFGTWVQIQDYFLIGANGSSYVAGVNGGSSNHQHPSAGHTHTIASHTHTSAQHLHAAGTLIAKIVGTGGFLRWLQTAISYTATAKMVSGTATLENAAQTNGAAVGGSTANTTPGVTGGTELTSASTTPGNTGNQTNLPPYMPVYMWKRTV